MSKVALSADFLEAYARIPRAQQKKVREFTEKFRMDPTRNSINYEPIHEARDEKVRSVRIGDDYRAIVVHPPQGDVYLCVWIDHHDEAMQWARNKRFDVSPAVGSLQIYEVREGAPPAAVAQNAERVPEERLFAGASTDDLLLCGVPELLMPSVRALRTASDLEELCPHLPREAADALYLLAAGASVEEALQEMDHSRAATAAVDTSNFSKALQHPDSQQRFKVVESERELVEMLNAPLELWRVFLHPSQNRLVHMRANGPVQALGGAGTGKTVALIHRARFLAREVFTDAADRILVTTFTRNLANDLAENLKTLCGPELERIEVANIHRWAHRFMRSQGVRFDIVSGRQRHEMWSAAYGEASSDAWPLAFYQSEWDMVVQAQDVMDRDAYFQARRTGRGTRLNRRERAQVWEVLSAYRAQLEQQGKVEQADVIRETRMYLEKHPGLLPYRAVLADEIQDFRTADLRLLRALVPCGPNDLFVVGDAHQRIYGHRASLGQCGIDVRGRSRRLRVNYRTTERIRNWAVALLEGIPIDDLNDGLDSMKGYRSLRVGVAPEVRVFPTEEQEAGFVMERLKQWLQSYPANEICIAVRTDELLDKRYRPLLDGAGIPHATLDTEAEAAMKGGVRLANMHRLKGLEFPRIIVAAVNDGQVPLRLSQEHHADEAGREDHEMGERSLLYVAATRARDELVVTGFGKPSPWIANQERKT